MCSFLVWKNACLNYREFDLEGDLVGVPHTWYLSAQSFIRLLKLVWRGYDIVAMNEWKKKCVGLQRTWVSKRTVDVSVTRTLLHLLYMLTCHPVVLQASITNFPTLRQESLLYLTLCALAFTRFGLLQKTICPTVSLTPGICIAPKPWSFTVLPKSA